MMFNGLSTISTFLNSFFHGLASSDSPSSTFPVATFALIVVILIGVLHYLLLQPLFLGKLSHVPGPKLGALSWYYLSYFDLRYQRNEKISEWHAIYGPVVRIRPNEVTLANPKDYREIYDSKSKYDKTTYFRRFTIYGEDNLFSTIKYHDHQVKKRRIAGVFSKSNVVFNAEENIRGRVDALLQLLQQSARSGKTVDFFVLCDCTAHDNMTSFLYGQSHSTNSMSDPRDKPIVVNLKRAQIWSPLAVNFGWLHGSWVMKHFLGDEYKRTLESRENLRKAIEAKLDEHDADPKKDEQYSLYRTMRFAAKNASGESFSRNAMASELYDELEAGQGTTASTLTYIFWRLSRHPEWQRRVQKEVQALKAHETGRLSLKDIETCSVLDAVIRETLRVHPVASGRQERVVPAGGRVYSAIYLPEGTTVIGPTLVLHHNVSAFPNPRSWAPERWLEADAEQLKAMEFSYYPFGHGARVCIGQHLAMLQIQLLVSNVYRRFETKLSETCTDEDMQQLGTLTGVPRGLRCELFVSEI